MNDEKIDRVLSQMFRKMKIPKEAKEELRTRLFKTPELSGDDLNFIAAAGEPAEQNNKNELDSDGNAIKCKEVHGDER
jgi:hypothetical protein